TLLSTAASITVVPGAASTSRTVPSGWMYVTRVIASCGRFWPLAGNPDLDEYPYSLCITLQASWAVIIAPIFVCRARLESAFRSVRERIGRRRRKARPCRHAAFGRLPPATRPMNRATRAMNAARSLLQNGGLVDDTGLRRTLLLTGCDCK